MKTENNYFRDSREHLAELRLNDEMMPSELALAAGLLLGWGMPGCAAAVARAYEVLYPDNEKLAAFNG